MNKNSRPFRLVSIQTVDSFPSATTRRATLASYASLQAAVAGGKRKLAMRPDLILRVYDGQRWVRDALGTPYG